MATFCVNTNSVNFQNLVNEYNIDPLSLEVTIFQWMKDNDKVWSEENNSELRDYIENEYSINKVFNVESKEMFDAYSKLYDAVSQTGSMSKEDALDLYSKVSQVVGDSNASLYMDNEGNWHVNMKMPSYEGMTSEMQSIKEKAIADGTFMKAPNGNTTNLTERQWLQVRTKAFKEWFGDWYNNGITVSKINKTDRYSIYKNGVEIGNFLIDDERGIIYNVEINSNYRGKGFGKNVYIAANRELNKNNITLKSRPNPEDGNPLHPNAEKIWQDLIKEGLAQKTEHGYDMINDNAVSKVVDENGEPLVVYHASPTEGIKIFNTDGDDGWGSIIKKGSFFTTDKSYIKSLIPFRNNVFNENNDSYIYEVFLNIREPLEPDEELGDPNLVNQINSLYEYTNNGIFYDGIKGHDYYDAITEKYGLKRSDGTEYVVFNSNQIKSATDNVGSFSTENDDIRYNQEMSELFDVIDYISRKEKFVMPVEDGQTQNYELLSKYHKRYYLPKTFGTEEQIQDKLETYLVAHDLPRDIVAFERTRSGRLVAYFNDEVIKDSIERNEANAEIGDLFSTPEETQSVTTVLNKLSAITGLKYKTITESEANKLVKGKDFSSTNAFVYNDTCYFIQGRKLNTDTAAEEMLHPFIAAVRKYNPKAFDSLLRDARRAFPKLRLEIAKTYGGNHIIMGEELVTQALSRALRKDIKDNPEGHKLKNLIKHFIDYVRDVFRSFVNINGRTTKYFTNIDNILQNKEVKAEDLASNIKIDELAKVINSDIEKLESDTKVFRQNIETSEKKQLLTESTIREKGYFKRGDTKILYNFTNSLQNSKGTKVAARRTTDSSGNNVINLDIDFLRQKYNDKSWNKPYIQPDNSVAEPLDENIFASFDEFLTFVVLHEYYHTQRKINEGETRGEYETAINNLALQDLKNNYSSDDAYGQFTQQSINITESTGSYAQRTRENADWSDITLALAVDFTTRGETLTAQQAGSKDFGYLGNREPRQDVKDKYIAAYPTGDLSTIVEELYNQIISKGLPTKNIKLNIAGNGIYSLVTNEIDSPFLSQNDVNNTVTSIIKLLQERKGITISEIRSGGQTGIDEAGIIAAQRLGIPASVHAPKGFAFRNAAGKDIYSKEQFLARFNQQPQQQPVFEQSKEATAEEANADEIVIEQNTLDEHASDMQEAFGEYDKTPVLNKTSSALKTAFDNLNSRGKLFPQKEKQHIAKVIVNYVSSLINNIKENGFEAIDAIYNDPYTEDLHDTMFINFPTDESINYKAMSRSEIINRVGLVNLLNYVKERYINPDMHFNLSEDKAENLRLAYDNWPAMLLMANKDMILCEGYTIDARFDTVEYGSDTEDIKGDFQADEQEVGETEAWGVRARSIPARSSMSTAIRREIRLTPVYDKNGKIVSDEFGYGFDSYCNPDALVNILYAKLHNCANLTQMKEVLTKYKSAFPEFQSILDKLNANKEFEDLFFSNFSKGQSLFYVVTKIYDEAAKRYVFKPIAINIGNFQTKFKNALIEKKYNGSLDLWNVTRVGDKYKFTESSYNDAINTLKKINEIRDTLKTSKNQDTLSQAITDFLDIFGIKNLFSEASIQAMAEDKSVLNVIESQLKTIYVKLDLELQDVKLKGVDNKETFSISEYSTDSNSIGAQLNKLAEALEEYAPVAIEPIAHENGKTYCAYSNPSLLDIISRKIHNDKEFDKFMEEEFKPSLMFYDSENDVWYNDVLAKMNSVSKNERTAARETFQHAVMLSFGDKDYIDMGETPLEACNILNYFIDMKGNKAYYKIPIPSDKNEFGFLMFYKKGKRQEFIDTFYDNVCQELIRINTVLRRSFKKKVGKIDFYDINKGVFDGVKSFKDLTQSQYIEKFSSEKFATTGAAFRYFPFLNKLITDERSPLGRALFAKMKGEKLENETEFRNAMEAELEKGMLEIVDEEVEKFYTDGLFEFETIWANSPMGKYPVYQNRFLAQLHDTHSQITSDIEKIAGEKKTDSKGNETYEIKNWRLTPAAIVKKGITDTLDAKFINYLIDKKVIIENNGVYSFNETTPAVRHGETLNMNESLRDQLYKMEMTQQVEFKLREYAWGNYYGRINITQVLVTDPAYFGDADKFQKRFSMSHSPGVRANLDATVKVGESKVKVTDGIGRTITLRDNKVASPAAEEVKNFYIQRAEKSEGAEKAFYLQCANDAYNALSSINQTDAQALSSLTAMRKKMAMFAKWADEFENAYQKIRANKGNWKIMQEILHDISGALSPLKPFVGANTIVPSGVVETEEDTGAMTNMRVPVMHKNSDYLLLMTDALMQSEGQKSILSELYRFMEDTHYDENGNYKTDGIDTIQFESAVKVGGKDALVISDATADNMYEKLQNHTYDENGQYKENSVIKYSYEYYSIQQETPNHMRDHKQLIGSQQRILNTADQNPDREIKIDGKKIKIKDAIDEYFKLHAANIYDSEQQLLGELLIDKDAFVKDLNRCIVKADKENTKEESENKLKTLLDLNYKNLPKSVKNKIINAYHKAAENYHGYVQAKDLVFHISQAERNECLSLIIKDAVINDAKFDSDMLVSCTVDENGKFTIPIDDAIQSARIEQLLFSIIKSRINKQTIKGGPAVQVSSFGIANDLQVVYKKDSNGNTIGVDHMQIYVTCPSKELEDRLTIKDKEGRYVRLMTPEEALKAKKITENELKAIGYRIPTEDTYSIIPLKIKGFLPRFAGDAIMLPAEHVAITGSDFDIDKFYLMFRENSKNRNSKQGRNDRIFDIEYELLQTQESMEKMMNPGNFDPLKKLSTSNAELRGIKKENMNPMMQKTDSYFYGQNTAAKKLIGVMANATTSHAFLSFQDIWLQFDIPFMCEGENITSLKLDPRRNRKGKLISKVLGSCIGAAADAAKDPVFKNLNITPATVNVAALLFRTGFSEGFVARFLAQPSLVKAVNEYEKRNSYEKASIKRIIYEKLKAVADKIPVNDFVESNITNYNFTEKELKDNLNPSNEKNELDIRALCLFYSLLDYASDVNTLTFLTKFNSITNAAGPTISEELAMERRIMRFAEEGCPRFIIYNDKGEKIHDNPLDVIKNNPILEAFYSTTIGYTGSVYSNQKEDGAVRQIMGQYFPQFSLGFQTLLERYDDSSINKLNEDGIEKLYKFYLLYHATTIHKNGEIPAILDGSVKGRKQFSSRSFIETVLKMKSENPDNTLLNTYSVKEKTGKCPIDVIDTDINGGSSDFNELIGGDWADMLNDDKQKDLAIAIALYSMYRGGLRYSPKTPLHTANSNIKLQLNGYTDLMEYLVNDTDTRNEFINGLISQFKRNNSTDTSIVPEFYTAKGDNRVSVTYDKGTLTITGKPNNIRLIDTQGTSEYIESVMKYKNDIYEFVSKKTNEDEGVSLIYHKTTKLGIKSNFIEVDANEGKNIKTIFTDSFNDNEGYNTTPDNPDEEQATEFDLLKKKTYESSTARKSLTRLLSNYDANSELKKLC